MWWELGLDQSTWLDRQGTAARKAVELDPGLAAAHVRLATYYFKTGDKARGREHIRKAAALDPDDPLVAAYSGELDVSGGDFEKAIASHRRFVERDPLSAVSRGNLAFYLFAAERLDEALSEFRKALELNPAKWELKLEMSRVLILQNRYDEAYTSTMQMPEGMARDHGLALLYRAPGRRQQADDALERLVARPGDYQDGIRLAEVFAFRGMNEKAFATLQRESGKLKGDDDLAPWHWDFQNELRLSPFLKPLHADPRWAALLVEPA